MNAKWRSNVKGMFEEIIECGGHNLAAMRMPLKITYTILAEVAQRANELQDPELNSLMARLCLFDDCNPYSEHYKGREFTQRVIDKDPELYK